MFARLISLFSVLFVIVGDLNAQLNEGFLHATSDTLVSKVLSEITIVGRGSKSDIHQLPQIVGTTIYASKKSSLIVMDNVHGNVVSNTMRQVMAKVPGIFVWESESSGIQIGIAARGLSPNRSWEFNVRQNGYDIAADPYGYPEAYYNPQLQSVQRIEVVRGHGALQYGPQIGGMVNYILKNGSEFTKPFQFETFQTVGSNSLFNSYNAVGGNTNKLHYYAFFDHRSGDGWRNNSLFRSNTGSATLTYKASKRLALTIEATRWESLSQQPAGLTDEQFQQDAKQSLRGRNWFNLGWLTSAIIADYLINEQQRLNIKLFGISADRNSIGFNPAGGILVLDNKSNTGEYSSRTVDIDQYRNLGMEARYLLNYELGRQTSSLSAGLRLFRGNTNRFRGGVGSRQTEYSIQREVGTTWVGDIDYNSSNAALFAENLFQVTDKLIFVPGVRVEYLQAQAGGYSDFANGAPLYLQDQTRSRSFIIGGLGVEYSLTNSTSLYANVTQSYRPVQFADLTTPPTTDVIDPNLTDTQGVNADVGLRGGVKDFLKFDVSAFILDYSSRVGTIRQQRQDGSFYNLRTNVGSSRSKGIELFAEYDLFKSLSIEKRFGGLELFTSYAYNDARYNDLRVVTVVNNTLQETNYKNKKVEYAPENIFRAGITYSMRNFSITVQQSYTDSVFTDANNTNAATPNGQNGKISSYQLYDVTAGYKSEHGIRVNVGINNLSDERYFTRRAGGYPGPGILPGDGRTFFCSVGYVLK